MEKSNLVYLLTGGNIGDRLSYLQQATKLLELSAGILITSSSVYETAAWGNTAQPAFLNQVLLIQTSLSPATLLETILNAEEKLGRVRTIKNAPRLIDIDILFYNDEIIEAAGLCIPHTEIANRRFVLEPLVEIAPAFIHPVLNKNMQELLSACDDKLEVTAIQI